MTYAKGADKNRRRGFPDPTAGVALWPRRIHCPRCGIEKGTTTSGARKGRCADCRAVESVAA